AIQIFFDVAFIILIPIIYSFSKAAGLKSPMAFGLPLALMLFILVTGPPHPGIAGSAAVTNGDVGMITMLGLLICIPVGFVAYYTSKWINRRSYAMLPETKANYDSFGTADADEAPREWTRPGAASVMFSVLLPVVMIGIGTVGKLLTAEGSAAYQVLSLIGAPAFALLISCVVAGILLGTVHGWKTADIAHVMDGALGPAAVVVFVTGAGGVLARVLTETGIGAAVSDVLLGTGMPVLLLCFVLAALLRAAQGSATVSALTTAGLLQSTLAGGDYSSMDIVLLNLAIGCGAITLSHINDSGFWIVTRYLGLSVADGLRTWTPLVTLLGTSGFGFVALLWLVL
ncbi:MAG: transporter, partial [Arachnia sp.]